MRNTTYFIKARSNGPNIGLIAVFSTGQDFRGHVQGRPQHGGRQLLISQDFSEAKISDLNCAIMFQNVGQFEISVHNIVLNKSFEGIEDLNKILNSLFFREFLFINSFCKKKRQAKPYLPHFQILIEVPFIAILDHKINIVGSLLYIIQFDDIIIITAFEDFDLILQ